MSPHLYIGQGVQEQALPSVRARFPAEAFRLFA